MRSGTSMGRGAPVAVGVDHGDGPALPLDHLASRRPCPWPAGARHVGPAHGPVGPSTWGPVKPAPQGHRHARGASRLQSGSGRGVDHRVAQARHQQRRAQADGGGALSRPGQRHPHVVSSGGESYSQARS